MGGVTSCPLRYPCRTTPQQRSSSPGVHWIDTAILNRDRYVDFEGASRVFQGGCKIAVQRYRKASTYQTKINPGRDCWHLSILEDGYQRSFQKHRSGMYLAENECRRTGRTKRHINYLTTLAEFICDGKRTGLYRIFCRPFRRGTRSVTVKKKQARVILCTMYQIGYPWAG